MFGSKQKNSDKELKEKEEPTKEKANEILKKDTKKEVVNWQARAEKHLDGWKRCQADFENYKKRQEGLQWELAKYSGLNLIMQILPVLDNFHASTDHIPADQKDNPWVVGIMYIQKQLEKILEDNGVKEIKTKAGDEFDPKIHEAIKDSQQSTVEGSEKNKDDGEPKTDNCELIKRVVLKGYKMDDRVVRAARVIVG
jgi:molecular chaperone GrpE